MSEAPNQEPAAEQLEVAPWNAEEALIIISQRLDELVAMANSEEVKAAAGNLTEGAATLVDSVLDSVGQFFQRLG